MVPIKKIYNRKYDTDNIYYFKIISYRSQNNMVPKYSERSARDTTLFDIHDISWCCPHYCISTGYVPHGIYLVVHSVCSQDMYPTGYPKVFTGYIHGIWLGNVSTVYIMSSTVHGMWCRSRDIISRGRHHIPWTTWYIPCIHFPIISREYIPWIL